MNTKIKETMLIIYKKEVLLRDIILWLKHNNLWETCKSEIDWKVEDRNDFNS